MADNVPTSGAILDAAERLFADSGFHGTTFRDIAKEAGVNLAAAHYHYGDKETLYLEVLRRRLLPLTHARLERLNAAERAAAPEPVPLERILEILTGPLFELAAQSPGGAAGARLIGRCLAEPLPFLEPFLAVEMQPVLARFAQAIRRHCPSLSPEEFLWRFSFVVGALQHTLATLHQIKKMTQGICRDDAAVAQARFQQFAQDTFTRTGPFSVS
jgi:AcrR family transcriptional regulator